MQKTVYKCDSCKKEIGDNYHISLMLKNSGYGYQNVNGVSIPPKDKQHQWKVKGLESNFIHFCNGQCIGRFFADKIKEAKIIKTKKK